MAQIQKTTGFGVCEGLNAPRKSAKLLDRIERLTNTCEWKPRSGRLLSNQEDTTSILYQRILWKYEVGISEKRCPSPLPSALRAAIPLFAYAQPPPTAVQPPASATRLSGSRTTPTSGNSQLPKHLESDSVPTMRLSTASERTSLIEGKQLDNRR